MNGRSTASRWAPARVCTLKLSNVSDSPEIIFVGSLYEAGCQRAPRISRECLGERIGGGLTAVTVRVRQPEVEHRIVIKNFERWLESNGKTPAEIVLEEPTSTIACR